MTMWVPTAPTSGLWYPKKDLGESVAAGELLGEIKTVFGETLASIHGTTVTGSKIHQTPSL